MRAAALAGLLALAACGAGAASPAGPGQNGQGQAVALNLDLDPGTSLHGVPAPGFRLVNQFGQSVSLSQFRDTAAQHALSPGPLRPAST